MQPLNPKDTVVLIVEDNPDDAQMAALALERFGIKKLYAAGTAEEALTFLAKQPCDVALIDYNLPGMNGLRLLERIRESWPEIRAIVVTGVRDEKVAVSAMKLGAADYVAKDELLTSGIVRALQSALREKTASEQEERRGLLSSGTGKLEVALQEADWLLESLSGGPDSNGRGALRLVGSQPEHAVDVLADDSVIRTPSYGEADLSEVLDAFFNYLQESFRRFPDPATGEEGALIRMLIERGTSLDQVLAVYKACLRSLDAEQTEPPFNPIVCLASVCIRLVEHYQASLAFQELNQTA